MLPFLRDGDLLLVSPVASSEIVVGDVLCYEKSPGRLFLHRVIKRRGEQFVTKGDALDFTDVIVWEEVLGKVIAVERHGRVRRLDSRWARWRNRAIVSLSPLLPSLLHLALPVRRLWRAVRCG